MERYGRSSWSAVPHCRESIFFDPKKFDIKQGDHVIVETARGVEYGRVSNGQKEKWTRKAVSDELKPVLRIATREDKDAALENLKKEKGSFLYLFTERSGSTNWR